jgi:hypothetical protein
MDSRPDDFIELRRLLALKRHEQPPPGYFDGFSRKVIVRIRAGEEIRDNSFFGVFAWEGSWLQRLWASLETRPVYAGGFGFAVCGFLLAGVLLSEKTGPTLSAAPNEAAPAHVQISLNKDHLFLGSSGEVGPSSSRLGRSQLQDPFLQPAKAPGEARATLLDTSIGN